MESNYLNLDSSILYRCNQKYFDKALKSFDLSYTGMLVLTSIYENEGCSLNDLVLLGAFDKGTISKVVQKLEERGYLETSIGDDRRTRQLHTTTVGQSLVPELYKIKSQWVSYLSSEVSIEQMEVYNSTMAKLVDKARDYANKELESKQIDFYGLQKLTLLDYPGTMACTLFTGGCNFRCPFCHNRSLVFLSENESRIPKEDIMDYLRKRKGILDGVCITGGEPTLAAGLQDFIVQVRNLGYKIKLDTNGSNFTVLKQLIDEKLVDYVAMDIKNCPSKYGQTIGLTDYDLCEVIKSKNYLLEGKVDYEFRTTVVQQFHEVADIVELAKWIQGAKHYYLQNFEDHGTCINEGLSAVDPSVLHKMKQACKPFVEQVEIRGIEE